MPPPHPPEFRRRAVELELVTESYRLVVANLPKSRRPVDPARFGTG